MAYFLFLYDMNVNSKDLWDKWLNPKWVVLLETFQIMAENEIVFVFTTFCCIRVSWPFHFLLPNNILLQMLRKTITRENNYQTNVDAVMSAIPFSSLSNITKFLHSTLRYKLCSFMNVGCKLFKSLIHPRTSFI